MSNMRGIRFHGVASLTLSAALAALIWLSSPTVVKAQAPKRGSIPELLYAYGMAVPVSSTQETASFQRDGVIADIHVKVGDQFKKGDRLLDFAAIGSIKDSEILAAPFDGVVTAILVNKGERVSANAPLMTLLRSGHLILVVGLEPSALIKVKPNQRVLITALSSDCKPGEGKLRRIGVAIDPKTRQVPVFIEFPDEMADCGESFKAEIDVGGP
jgi:multidrug efflux pump subunit AcrA (membrane-fusion protein)